MRFDSHWAMTWTLHVDMNGCWSVFEGVNGQAFIPTSQVGKPPLSLGAQHCTSIVLPLLRDVLPHIGMPELLLQQLLQLQGLLHGCSKAIKQMHKPAKPGLRSACSLSTCQQLQPEPNSKLVTGPTVKAELRGLSPTHQSSSVQPEGSVPLCLLGNEVKCLSADTDPGHNSTASGVQQDVAVIRGPLQLPQQGAQMPMQYAQQGATHGLVPGRSSYTKAEAEKGSGCGQEGFSLGLDQCLANTLHEASAVKRRCMPDWGKSNRAAQFR